MRKILSLIIMVHITTSAIAQQESAQAKSVIKLFTEYINSGHYDLICNLFNEKAKSKFPHDRTMVFLEQLQTRYGNIKNTTFMSVENTFTTYLADLDKGQVVIWIAVDSLSTINGLFAKPYQTTIPPKAERNTTKLSLPFSGEWTIFWGGDTKALNLHNGAKFQQYAFDIVINGLNERSYKTDGRSNTDYYAFGEKILAPADATVVLAVDGVADNVPSKVNTMYVPGNSVILKTANNEYLFFAHFKQNTVNVKDDDVIKQGQLLGRCGNSGNSSEPHLHFHIQDAPNFDTATGIKCYFERIYVNSKIMDDHSPIKGERIGNIKH
ncbi:peptidoglycan DD-metalloendopeptidase family protein [Pedobacter sp. JCM 36344]|uniref:peptidoglycan DD-metalloendopeptidase family protein n=1 Tax=Pedobacter sp. JCM 36344 TaxID=3374280 RepID=UPI00397DB724